MNIFDLAPDDMDTDLHGMVELGIISGDIAAAYENVILVSGAGDRWYCEVELYLDSGVFVGSNN